ncbi:MAG: AAC(3) family N-acetyltransferase, partial [Gemmatimonadota bacterium]
METTSVTRAQIAAGLRELGLGTGVVAFVHSSLSSFGHVDGGAEAVVAAFLEVLGPEGTLAAPIFRRFFWEGPDQVWDRDASPSLMGRISEAVRTWPGARRSAHAPHPIAAVGRLAADLTGRRNRSDFAFDSPFARLIELEARIVLVGVGYQVCTLMHLLEERCEIPYRHWVELEGTVVEDGRAARRAYPFLRRHEGVHNDFAPLGEALEREGLVRQVTVGDSRLRAFGARDLYDQGLRCLRRDPLFLVSRETRAAAEAHLSRFGATLDRAAVPGIQQPSHPVARRLAGVLRVPAAPAPPEAQVRHRWEMGDGVTIEELRLTGGPNPLVPATLALPAGSRGPLPAVICLHGTGGSWERLMEEPFRPHPHAATLIGWGRELARRGFAVL